MMPTKRASASQLPQFVFAPGKAPITPFDITKTTKISATVGFQFVNFKLENVGGTGNLSPGFQVNVSEGLNFPKDATLALVFLVGFNVGYVDQNGNLVDHHLGELQVQCGFTDHTTVTCTFLLRDSSTSEGILMFASAVVLYFAT